MAKNTDLHTHSYYSDGQISPKELVNLAKKRRIKNLALTDHDSVGGVWEAIKQGRRVGVNVIPAVEMRVHSGELLAYFIDLKNKKLMRELKKTNKKVLGKVKDWCKKLKKGGYDISFAQLKRKFPKTKNFNEFFPLYFLHLQGYGTTLEIAKKLGENKKLRAKGTKKKMPIPKAIKLIKQAGGVPVLAHPWIGNTEKNFKRMKSFVKAGLVGIEINNGDRAPFKEKSIDRKIRQIAKKYNLILTSGSDFHGDKITKQMPGNHRLGKNNCDEKIVAKLRLLSCC